MNRARRGRGVGTLVAVLAVVVAVGVIACDQPRSSLRPSASLLDVEFTPQATVKPLSSDEPTAGPTFISLPVGWDNAFCSVFTDAVVAQELVNDVQRALDEGDARDARGLARDLRNVTADAATLLADVPDWEPGVDATLELATLVDLGGRAGAEYGTYFSDNARSALRRAKALRREIGDGTPAANEALAALASLGIVCEGLPLRLEEF